MAEKQIIFNGEMIRGILDGRKTQMRPVVKRQRSDHTFVFLNGEIVHTGAAGTAFGRQKCPYGAVGDMLWVGETWGLSADADEVLRQDGITPGQLSPYDYDDLPIFYRADGGNELFVSRWRPSIHMPRWASRITLEITAVRVERVQDITEEDVVAEGLETMMSSESGDILCVDKWTHDVDYWESPRFAFAALWNKLNAKRGYSWNANPWVWVVEFAVRGAAPTKTTNN